MVPGVTLSRWTMAYFACALAALIGAEALMAGGYGYPSAPAVAPESLVVVHLVAIGWLSLLVCGALFQFVPVLVARPLHSDFLPLPALVCLAAGLVALLLGFVEMSGRSLPRLEYLPAAAGLLGAGFGLALWNLGRTLWSARPIPLAARFVVVGLFSLASTVALGIVFALVLGGTTATPALFDIAAAGLPLHVAAGLGGWLTFSAMGVSYRLLAMFMLAPELDGRSTRAVFYCGAAALTIAIVGGVAAIVAVGSVRVILYAAGLLGLIALALYGADIAHLYRARKRRVIELNSRMAVAALASLLAVVVLAAASLATGTLGRNVPGLLFLASFGWLSGLGLAKLYKIVAFLTWLECYGPLLGRTVTPRVQDLVAEKRAAKWFGLYFVSAWSATLFLLFEAALPFRAAAGAMAIATIGIAVQLVQTRRLANVDPALQSPPGACRPRLLFTSVVNS